MQYLKNDEEVVIGTYLPTHGKVRGLTDENLISWGARYESKHGHRFIYVLKRGGDVLLDPLRTGASSVRHPSFDAHQNLYFVGGKPDFSFFRMEKDGSLSQWTYPWNSFNQDAASVAFLDGSGVVFIFYYKNEDGSHKGIAIFDVQRETWKQIAIPDFEKGTPIVVQLSAAKNS